MSVGTSIPLPAYTLDPAFMARTAESLGFESIWYAEHPILPVSSESQFPSGGPIPWTYAHFADPYIALARASGATSTIKLGTGITLVPERNPLMLAKEIATLDRVSGGRFLFGIGAGWNREETEIFGGDFDHRWTQTREAVDVMKELWTQGRSGVPRNVLRFPAGQVQPQTSPAAAPAGDPGRAGPPGAATGSHVGRRVAAEPDHAGRGGRKPKRLDELARSPGARPQVADASRCTARLRTGNWCRTSSTREPTGWWCVPNTAKPKRRCRHRWSGWRKR